MGILQFNSEKVAPIASRFEEVQRTVFTDGVGKDITSASNLEQALKLSGLDYKVEKRPLQFLQPVAQKIGDKEILVQTPYQITDKVATVRTMVSMVFILLKLIWLYMKMLLTFSLWIIMELRKHLMTTLLLCGLQLRNPHSHNTYKQHT